MLPIVLENLKFAVRGGNLPGVKVVQFASPALLPAARFQVHPTGGTAAPRSCRLAGWRTLACAQLTCTRMTLGSTLLRDRRLRTKAFSSHRLLHACGGLAQCIQAGTQTGLLKQPPGTLILVATRKKRKKRCHDSLCR